MSDKLTDKRISQYKKRVIKRREKRAKERESKKTTIDKMPYDILILIAEYVDPSHISLEEKTEIIKKTNSDNTCCAQQIIAIAAYVETWTNIYPLKSQEEMFLLTDLSTIPSISEKCKSCKKIFPYIPEIKQKESGSISMKYDLVCNMCYCECDFCGMHGTKHRMAGLECCADDNCCYVYACNHCAHQRKYFNCVSCDKKMDVDILIDSAYQNNYCYLCETCFGDGLMFPAYKRIWKGISREEHYRRYG